MINSANRMIRPINQSVKLKGMYKKSRKRKEDDEEEEEEEEIKRTVKQTLFCKGLSCIVQSLSV